MRHRLPVVRTDATTAGNGLPHTMGRPLMGNRVGSSSVDRVVVIIPTYNERENLEIILARVRTSVPDVGVLVVDDNSPDGTGKLADQLAAADPQVHVLHRSQKSGLGAAYIAGFHWALEHGYGAVVEMDADGSHQPEQLPDLLAALTAADMVIGSRWIPGGEVINWPRSRQLLSRIGNTYARLALGISLRDATGGYRAYRTTALRQIAIEKVESRGYCFQVDIALLFLRGGFKVIEVPIKFEERARGISKMSANIILEALWRITRWGIVSRWRALRASPDDSCASRHYDLRAYQEVASKQDCCADDRPVVPRLRNLI
jgi:dolichol-phosphate mannosyltransferase